MGKGFSGSGRIAICARSSERSSHFRKRVAHCRKFTFNKAYAAAAAAYNEFEYKNVGKKGPVLTVIPGETKSNNTSFNQRLLPNNIAAFGELELSQANFTVLERANKGKLLNEIAHAHNLSDMAQPRKSMKIGKLKATKWMVKFDILKA
jgi:hypothetical protein